MVSQLSKNFKLLASVHILLSDIRNNRTHSIDVVGHNDATKCLYKDNAYGLQIVRSHQITKANSKHYIRCPVIRPNVSLKPWSTRDSLDSKPVMRWIKICHCSQNQSDDVGIAEVNKKHFDHFPILFIIDISDEVNFYFLDFVQTLRQLHDDKHSKVAGDVLIGDDVQQ